jgi:hypothetical protein
MNRTLRQHALSLRGCGDDEKPMKRHLSFIAAFGMCFFAPVSATYAQQIKADTGSIAIGGSVTGSTINIGIPPEQLAALVRQAADLSKTQKKVIAKLEDELDLNQRQIRAALGILGENEIPPERLAAKLVEIAERFKDLQATASAQPGDDPKIAALKTNAQKAIEAGELAKADALLADVETEQRQALDRLALNAAETAAQRGEVALTRERSRGQADRLSRTRGDRALSPRIRVRRQRCFAFSNRAPHRTYWPIPARARATRMGQ